MTCWCFALVVLIGATTAAALPANLFDVLGQWSDPVTIADTVVPARPALLTTSKGLLLLWLDRHESTVEIRRAVLDERGIPIGRSSMLAVGADSQFGWPVAASVQNRVFVVWMARADESVQLMGTVLNASGDVVVAAHPLGPAAEESGTLAMLPAGGRVHVAWSQFDHGERRIWYLRLASDGQPEIPVRPIARGEAPTLIPGDVVRLLWWQSVGFDQYRLMLGQVDAPVPTSGRSLTPPILQGRVTPPIVGVGPDGLDVLLPVVERGFGTRERLYHLRLTESGPTPRKAVAGISSIGEFSGALVNGEPVAVWITPTGRTRHLAVFTAHFDTKAHDLDQPIRVNYTAAGARVPTIALGPNRFNAAWLQVTGLAHFRLVVATTQNAQPRRFLFGIPELDVSRPIQFGLFVGTVLLTILPYTLVYVAGFSLIAFALPGLGLGLLGSLAWKEPLHVQPGIRLLLFLFAALALEILGRGIIPGDPDVRLLIGALAIPGAAIVLAAQRRYWPPLQLWAMSALALWVQLVAVLLPWGVFQLSQF